jgi:Ca2+-binding RTX toxin-like protein
VFLRIESLESRTVPATVTLTKGTLSVIGGLGPNNLTVNEAGGQISVPGSKINVNGVMKTSVPSASVARVFVSGLAGDDVINCSTVTKRCTIIGGIDDDSITGGLGNDDIYGRDGSDSMFGGGGTDKMYGENGDDTVWGDDGNDTLFGGAGNDVLAGRGDNDQLFCESGNDLGSGGDGNDTVLGNIGDDSLFGGNGNDSLKGEDGNDEVNGDLGDDIADGGNGNDTLIGFDGDDELIGLGGNDSMDGGVGEDSMYGGAGNDRGDGGADGDLIYGDDGVDTLHGGNGDDTIAGGAGSDFLFGDDGNDLVAANTLPDIVDGGLGDDTLAGSSSDIIIGGGGNDTIIETDDGNGDGNGNTDEPGSGFNSRVYVFQTIRAQWTDGSTNDITIRNIGTTNINGWKVEFDADFEITEFWNAQLVSNDSGHYTFENIPGFWNTQIQPNNQITFGFNTHLASGDSRAIRNIEFDDDVLTPGAPPGPPPNPNTEGTVTPSVRAQWPDGATIDVTIRNTGTSNINGWTVEFDADFDITEVWNAQLVSRVGNHYTIRNIPGFWNTLIRPNNEITFGFNTHLDPGDSTAMSNITLNGNPA